MKPSRLPMTPKSANATPNPARRGPTLVVVPPVPPTPGPRDKDQYNFTDPESRIMKNSNNDGFDQHDNAPLCVEHAQFLDCSPAPCPTIPTIDAEALPTLDALPLALGTPKAGALDNGSFSAPNIAAMDARDIEPYHAPPGVYPIIPVGRRILRNSPSHRQRRPLRRYTWPTHSRPTLAARSTAGENVQSNRCWALSKTPWVFANSRCVACGPPLANGVWCVSPST